MFLPYIFSYICSRLNVEAEVACRRFFFILFRDCIKENSL